MSLILSVKDESNFKPCPAGSHHATCIRIIDLGTQLVEYQNEQKRQHKILVQWEIDPEGDPEMLMPDGRQPSRHLHPHHRFGYAARRVPKRTKAAAQDFSAVGNRP
ncbi:hypothetical protein [Neisseria gonorrhoeae]|uniref:hypothetical protein n=1 Tax=Neisseria gonorrhoeae TaxID=485 RepID=UPI002805D8B6|nr:hypothetical protein [Neisseria gonorrhoeae]